MSKHILFRVRDSFGQPVQLVTAFLLTVSMILFIQENVYSQIPEAPSETTKVALKTEAPLPAIPFNNKSNEKHTLSLGNSPITLAEPTTSGDTKVQGSIAITPVAATPAASPIPQLSFGPQEEPQKPELTKNPTVQQQAVTSTIAIKKQIDPPLVLPGPQNSGLPKMSIETASTQPVATPQWSPLPTTSVMPAVPVKPAIESQDQLHPPVPLGPESTGLKPDADDKDFSSKLKLMQQEIDELKKGMKKKQDTPDPNKKFVNKVGGLLMLNPLFVSQDAENKAIYGDAQNQLEFQELRLILTGKGYGNLAYECTFGYNNGINFKDLRLTISDTPWLDEVRLGYFKVETGMNLQEWASNGPFIAQNSNTRAFRINRRIGAGSAHYYADERLRVFGGIFCGQEFNPSDDAKISSDLSGIILNTRITGLPIYCEDDKGISREVLHIGSNFTWVDPSNGTNNTARLRVRPTSWTGSMPYMLNGTLDLDQQTYTLTGLETAWQKNQFAIQSEGFIGAYEDYSSAWSYNIMARYFLTPGACRIYDKHKGCFGKVNVPKNFMMIDQDGCRFFDGWGAWELTAMYTRMNLENLRFLRNPAQNRLLRYGMYDEYIVGLNWFWNQQTAIMFNYIHSETDGAMIGSTDRNTSTNDTIGMQLRLSF